jgi:hypothetical protein
METTYGDMSISGFQLIFISSLLGWFMKTTYKIFCDRNSRYINTYIEKTSTRSYQGAPPMIPARSVLHVI